MTCHPAICYMRGVALFLACLLGAAPVQSAMDAQFGRLLELSGITRQAEELPGVLRAGFEQGAMQGAELPREMREQILDSVDQHLDPVLLLEDIRYAVFKRLDHEDISSLLRWYESDVGRRIAGADAAGSSAAAMNEMMARSQELLAMEDRVAWAQRVDALLRVTEMNYAIQSAVGTAVYRALLSAAEPGKAVDVTPFREQMQTVAADLHTMMQQMVLVNLVYVYRDLDLPTLTRYEAFLNEPKSLLFNTAVADGMKAGMAQAIDAWVKDVTRIAMELEQSRQ